MTDSTYTHLGLVVDSSGSMFNIAGAMNGAIEDLLKQQAAVEGKLLIDLVRFSNEPEYLNKGALVGEIGEELIHPGGLTALNDAIMMLVGEMGHRFSKMKEDERPGKVIVAIVTDGAENASVAYPSYEGTQRVKAKLDEQRDTFSWEILFIGAETLGNVMGAAAQYGVGRDHTLAFDFSPQGAQAASASFDGYITRSRSGDTTGFTEEERAAASGN